MKRVVWSMILVVLLVGAGALGWEKRQEIGLWIASLGNQAPAINAAAGAPSANIIQLQAAAEQLAATQKTRDDAQEAAIAALKGTITEVVADQAAMEELRAANAAQNGRIDALSAALGALTTKVGSVSTDLEVVKGRLDDVPTTAELLDVLQKLNQSAAPAPPDAEKDQAAPGPAAELAPPEEPAVQQAAALPLPEEPVGVDETLLQDRAALVGACLGRTPTEEEISNKEIRERLLATWEQFAQETRKLCDREGRAYPEEIQVAESVPPVIDEPAEQAAVDIPPPRRRPHHDVQVADVEQDDLDPNSREAMDIVHRWTRDAFGQAPADSLNPMLNGDTRTHITRSEREQPVGLHNCVRIKVGRAPDGGVVGRWQCPHR